MPPSPGILPQPFCSALGFYTWYQGFFPAKSPEGLEQNRIKAKSKMAVILGLTIAMLFSPCLELSAFYVQAGQHGWAGFILVSLVYLVVTLSDMTALVIVCYRNIDRLKWGWLGTHEKQVTGLTLIFLAVLSFLQN